jgi:osmoprotectant transport system ATP-binding protein
MPQPAIAFRDVSFSRGEGHPVLTHFTLEIAAGEVVALVGRSGAGKTTLLKLVNRLLVPSSGDVFVEGRTTREWQPIQLRRRIGYVLQDVGLFPHLNVSENIAMLPRLMAWPPDRIANRVTQLLELVGLGAQPFASRWPDELSGGQRQRVGVARALAVDPPVLLMDEPFGALDPVTRAELHAEFNRIQRRLRKTVMIVTHDMGEAFALADRIGVVEQGELIASEVPEGIAASQEPRIRQLLNAMPTWRRTHGSEAAERR